jgi:hypothetical protein
MNIHYAADKILDYINKPEHENVMFDYEDIQKALFPSEDAKDIEAILEWINQFNPIPAIAKYQDYYIYKTVHTGNFLKSGGFTKIYESEQIESKKQARQKDLELRKTETDLELAEKSLKDYKWTKWMSRIAFFISICLATLELIKWLKQGK